MKLMRCWSSAQVRDWANIAAAGILLARKTGSLGAYPRREEQKRFRRSGADRLRNYDEGAHGPGGRAGAGALDGASGAARFPDLDGALLAMPQRRISQTTGTPPRVSRERISPQDEDSGRC